MKRWYWFFRLTGYGAGLAALLLILLGRQGHLQREPLFSAGGILLILSFAAFFISYVLYVFTRGAR